MSVAQETSLTIFSLLLGSIFALLFDLSTLFGRKVRHMLWQNALDVLIWLIYVSVFAYGLFVLASGRLRIVTFGFLLLGALLYFRLLRKPVLGLLRYLGNVVVIIFLRPLWAIVRILLFPLFYVVRLFVTMIISFTATSVYGLIRFFDGLWSFVRSYGNKLCFWCQKGG